VLVRVAALVPVVAFGSTRRPPSSTEVLVRLIGLAVILALDLVWVPLPARHSRPGRGTTTLRRRTVDTS
jgi:hypothetical protein